MQYIHVKNIEKFHPGYKDRTLLWAKINLCMAQGDPEMEMITNEIDKWRFICFILLELQARKPIPLDDGYLIRKGFELKKRSMSLTIEMLHNFIEVVTEDFEVCSVEEIRVDESREEKDKIIISSQNEILLSQIPPILKEKVLVYIDRVKNKNKSKIITEGRKNTLLNELISSRSHCNNDDIFSKGLEAAIDRDACCIGYVNAVIKNKKTQKPR